MVHARLAAARPAAKLRKKYDCNMPWILLFDPTSACNLHCKGCWAAEYGNRLNLSFEDMMARYKTQSEEKIADLKRVTENHRGGYSRRRG